MMMLSVLRHCGLRQRRILSFRTQIRTMKIVPVPVRSDNYAYLLIDETSKTAAAVDPYDVPKVSAAADEHGVRIIAALTTHHHDDHAGGNPEFVKKYPDAPIYGGSNRVLALSKLIKDKDEFKIGDSIQVKCLATPCHTQDSICYHVTDSSSSHPGGVFTGDTLFIAGCGRFFEGVGSEMISALDYLGKLPDKTIVYNGHEYTKSSLAFGKHVDPSNPAISKLEEIVKNNKITTGLTTIADEKGWNVFMRLDSTAVREATSANKDTPQNEVMDTLRDQKNNFKG
ncbi:beta-lactamase-like protein [Crepidotus variabilis]|uniref:hydroxyacylglutathione hydrolase n=1 Tax=Crepidotus variabilis TaxID=179855 RepID=A0A9P6JUB1_9AGAR|nr:beta-lactamase-like protein [Crepidotus variabilis]